MSGATGHLILPLLALSWTRWTTPDFQCCLILYDTNPSNCPIILYSTIVQYCTNYSQFRLEIYYFNLFQQNMKITLFNGKKENWIEKESFESLFCCFWHFLSKSFAKLYFDVTEWKYPRGLFEYPYDNLTFFYWYPYDMKYVPSFSYYVMEKSRKRILEFLFSSAN